MPGLSLLPCVPYLGAEGGAEAAGGSKHRFKNQPGLHSKTPVTLKVGVRGLGPKELQVSSGQRDKGGRKGPRTSDSKIV